MRVSLVAFEDIIAGDAVTITPAAAGRVVKTKITGTFEEAISIGVAQNTTAAGNICVITTDGPTETRVYRGQLTPGEDYYAGISATPVTYQALKTALVTGGYTTAWMQHLGTAASNDQMALDVEAPVGVIPSAL